MDNTGITDLVIQVLIGLVTAAATLIIAWYAKVQHDFLKFQTKSQYNKLKDWVFERIIEQNVNELEHKFQKVNVDDHGSLTINELFEYIRDDLWDKKWNRQKRKSILLKILAELTHENYVQNFFVDKKRASLYAHHGFGECAVGFAYYDRNNPRKKLVESVDKLTKSVEKLTRELENR